MMDSPEARPPATVPWLFGAQGLGLLAFITAVAGTFLATDVTYLAGALLLVGLGTWGALETRHADSLEQQLGALKSQHTADANALKTTNASLDTAVAAARQWKETCTTSADQARLAKEKSLELQRRLDASHQSFTRSQEKDRATPKCQQLLTTDLAAACPGIAQRLRELPSS